MVNGADSFVLFDFQQRILLVGEKGQLFRLLDHENGGTTVPWQFANCQSTETTTSQDFDLLLFVFCGLASDTVPLLLLLAQVIFVALTSLNDRPLWWKAASFVRDKIFLKQIVKQKIALSLLSVGLNFMKPLRICNRTMSLCYPLVKSFQLRFLRSISPYRRIFCGVDARKYLDIFNKKIYMYTLFLMHWVNCLCVLVLVL
jgi:hypothetical protein